MASNGSIRVDFTFKHLTEFQVDSVHVHFILEAHTANQEWPIFMVYSWDARPLHRPIIYQKNSNGDNTSYTKCEPSYRPHVIRLTVINLHLMPSILRYWHEWIQTYRADWLHGKLSSLSTPGKISLKNDLNNRISMLSRIRILLKLNEKFWKHREKMRIIIKIASLKVYTLIPESMNFIFKL